MNALQKYIAWSRSPKSCKIAGGNWRLLLDYGVHLLFIFLEQEKICEESASFDLSSAEVASAVSEVSRVLEKLQELQKNEEFLNVDSESSSSSGCRMHWLIFM